MYVLKPVVVLSGNRRVISKHSFFPFCLTSFLSTNFREVVSAYSVETKKLITKISDVISEGLGFEKGYLGGELSKVQLLSVNYYPPCPDPNLALGMHSHCDPNLFTVLYQGNVYGLQILKDGKWTGVEPLPNAFVVFIGCQLQVFP